MRHFVFVFLLSFGLALPAHAQIAQVIPVDEAAQDAELMAFRDRLLTAVIERDVDYIISVAHPEIHLDFGGGTGTEELRNRLSEGQRFYYAGEDDSDTKRYREELWLGFESALRLGGVLDEENGSFVAPHYFGVDHTNLRYDPFFTDFVIADNVAVRDRPNRYGEVIDRLDYEFVERLEGGFGTSYGLVKLEGGRQGWVHKDLLRSAVDYRVGLDRIDGAWTMTFLIAGD